MQRLVLQVGTFTTTLRQERGKATVVRLEFSKADLLWLQERIVEALPLMADEPPEADAVAASSYNRGD